MIVEDNTCEANLCRLTTSAESCPNDLESYDLKFAPRKLHDPRNTQVLLQEAATGVDITLQDADGVFLRVKRIVTDLEKHDDPLLIVLVMVLKQLMN